MSLVALSSNPIKISLDSTRSCGLWSRRRALLQVPTLQVQEKAQSYEDLLHADGFILGPVFARSAKEEGFFVRSAQRAGEEGTSIRSCLAVKCSKQQQNTGCMSIVLEKEFELLKNLKHPNIVVAKHFVQAEAGCAMVMELCPGERLERLATKGDGLEAKSQRIIMNQILCATVYLHNSKVAHRDLHSGNIIVDARDADDLAVKVVDFNCACQENGPIRRWCIYGREQPFEVDDLNPAILPPLIQESDWDVFSLDIFAIGLLTLGVMAARTVVTSDIMKSTMIEPHLGVELSRKTEAYVRSLLSFKSSERPTAALARERLPSTEEWSGQPSLSQ